MLEMTGTIPPAATDRDRPTEEAKNEQVLDTLKVERERGITVRAQSATMFHTHTDGETYMLNLLDTPGHADFSSELLRSLLPSQGALLLVDAAQGVQAQTLSVLDEALKRNLTVVGAGESTTFLLVSQATAHTPSAQSTSGTLSRTTGEAKPLSASSPTYSAAKSPRSSASAPRRDSASSLSSMPSSSGYRRLHLS